MTIAKAFNEIAIAQGGTADTSGTIAGAIDALNDALAGSDLPKKPRIEDGIRVLGQYIGGGGGQNVVVYFVEDYDGTIRQPEGTIKIGDSVITSTTTAESDGETVYGYEVPAGSMVEYVLPQGLVISNITYLIYSNLDDMAAFDNALFSANPNTATAFPAAGIPCVWIELVDE